MLGRFIVTFLAIESAMFVDFFLSALAEALFKLRLLEMLLNELDLGILFLAISLRT